MTIQKGGKLNQLERLLPEDCFALKGGTAINLFVRNMPRLSVDIDLTSITESAPSTQDTINKLVIRTPNLVQVKIEVTPLLRGSVYRPQPLGIVEKAEEEFGFAEINVLSFADLYAGKILAAFGTMIDQRSDLLRLRVELPVIDFLSESGDRAEYEYDFGDGWLHEVTLLGIEVREKGQRYPKCVAGERACPPEDCGGVHGYQSLLEVLFDPSHPEHESLSHWIPKAWGPELFKPEKVRFDNPLKRWQKAFTEADR